MIFPDISNCFPEMGDKHDTAGVDEMSCKCMTSKYTRGEIMSAAKMTTNREELIQALNHALNREVSTFLRYMLSAARIKGAQWAAVRDMYSAEVVDEVGHATYLADKIVMLGGTPELNPDLTPPAEDVMDMLRYDISQEFIDVQGYLRLAEIAGAEGMIDLQKHMEEQAADEAQHADVMQRMLG